MRAKTKLLFLFCCSFLCCGQVIAADPQLCKEYYKKKQYVRASQCFKTLAGTFEKKPKLTGQDRSRIFQYLRNASLCLRRAAKIEKSSLTRSFLQEQALNYIKKILKNKYYESPSQKNLAKLLEERIEEKVGYVLVTITTGAQTAVTKFSGGYRFKGMTKKGMTLQEKLRPGNYTIVVTYPKQTPKVKVLQLRPGQKPVVITLRLQAPPSRRQVELRTHVTPPPLAPNATPWVVVGIGAAAVMTGGILIGLAASNNSVNNERARQSLTAFQGGNNRILPTETSNIISAHQSANTMYTIGWVAGGAGVATIVTGLILYGTQKKK